MVSSSRRECYFNKVPSERFSRFGKTNTKIKYDAFNRDDASEISLIVQCRNEIIHRFFHFSTPETGCCACYYTSWKIFKNHDVYTRRYCRRRRTSVACLLQWLIIFEWIQRAVPHTGLCAARTTAIRVHLTRKTNVAWQKHGYFYYVLQS